MLTGPPLTHQHTALASASFDVEDAIWAGRGWAVYLDDTLALWEVYVDAVGQRTFVSSDTWEILDGPAEVAFVDDFVDAYRRSDTRALVFIDTTDRGPYGKAARRALAVQGVVVMPGKDRLTDLVERTTALSVEAAGINGAQSAYQRQVFAVRHAVLAQDLARLEQELAQARSAFGLATCALYDPAT